MNQTTDPEHETWRAPWAPPTRPGQPQTAGEGQDGRREQADTGSQPGVPADAGQPDRQAQGHPTQGYPAQHPTQGYPAQPQPPAAPPPGYPAPDPSGRTAFSGPGNWPGPSGQPAPAYVSPDPGYHPGYGAGPPPNGPNGPDRPDRGRDRSGPGWIGTVAIGAGAAVLASVLTGGFLYSTDRGSNGTTGSSFTQGQAAQPKVDAPVKSSTAANPDWDAVAAAVEPSVVSVQLSQGEGSGVLLDAEGRILTNNHVVAEGGTIHVVLNDGRAYPAEVVGTDATTDLAVIKITKPPAGLTPVVLGDSEAVKVGDPVMAVGNPLGLAGTVTTGIVSAVNRPVTTTARENRPDDSDPFGFGQGQQNQAQPEQVVTNAIQTDAAINPGNSGGALVDAQGRLIGINSSIASLSGSVAGSPGGSIGLGFAIPVNSAQAIAQELIKNGKALHPWIGVTLQSKTVTVDDAQRASAVAATVTAGSPAEKGGVKAGDAVIAIDGTAINGSDSMVATIRERRPGDVITMTVVRDGKTQDLKVTLGTKPGETQS
jgi:putative serine protease PepD